MTGAGAAGYGEAFADVYDQWYGGGDHVEARVAAVRAWAGGGPVLELGVGTGRLALPLARSGLPVWGIDVSPAMLRRLAAKPDGDRVRVVLGDMAELEVGADAPRFSLVLVADNTLLNLSRAEDQARCVRAAAGRLAPGGCLVVETFVPPAEDPGPIGGVELARLDADGAVLIVSWADAASQVVVGSHVQFHRAGLTRRPWRIRYLHPDQLDALAAAAGLRLAARHGGWRGEPFTEDSPVAVSVYTLA
jgi:SAM-dependent methyltransferase